MDLFLYTTLCLLPPEVINRMLNLELGTSSWICKFINVTPTCLIIVFYQKDDISNQFYTYKMLNKCKLLALLLSVILLSVFIIIFYCLFILTKIKFIVSTASL